MAAGLPDLSLPSSQRVFSVGSLNFKELDSFYWFLQSSILFGKKYREIFHCIEPATGRRKEISLGAEISGQLALKLHFFTGKSSILLRK